MAVSRFNPDYPDAGLVQVVPTSVAVGSGSGSVDGNGTVSFSGVNSISVNGCFTSSYNNYKIIFDSTGNSSGNQLNIKLRVSGTDTSGSDYNTQSVNIYSASTQFFKSNSRTSFEPGPFRGPNLSNLLSLEVFNPFRTIPTGFICNNLYSYSSTAVEFFQTNAGHTLSTSYDGITFIITTGTFDGTVQIYGYRK